MGGRLWYLPMEEDIRCVGQKIYLYWGLLSIHEGRYRAHWAENVPEFERLFCP